MKKTTLFLAIFALTLFIVLPGISSVNNSTSNTKLIADGWPVPPLPPSQAISLVADGWPVPPLPPSQKSEVNA